MLVAGIPMLPPDRVPALVQDDGRFHISWRPFIVASLTTCDLLTDRCRVDRALRRSDPFQSDAPLATRTSPPATTTCPAEARSAQGGLATCTFSDTLRVPAQAGSWRAARGLTATHWSV